MEGVAKEAGVAKQTIYRWWPSRGALIAECLIDRTLMPIELVVPDTGDLHKDVEDWLMSSFSILQEPRGGQLLRSLVAAAAEDSDVGDQLATSLGVERHLSERLVIGIRDGQLPEDAPIEQLGQAVIGIMILQALGKRSIDLAPVRQFVRFLLGGGSAA